MIKPMRLDVGCERPSVFAFADRKYWKYKTLRSAVLGLIGVRLWNRRWPNFISICWAYSGLDVDQTRIWCMLGCQRARKMKKFAINAKLKRKKKRWSDLRVAACANICSTLFWSRWGPSEIEYSPEYSLHLARNPFWLLHFNPLNLKSASNLVNIYFRNIILCKSRTFTVNGCTIWFSFTVCLLCSHSLSRMCDARVVRTEPHSPQDYPVWVMTMAWPMDAHTEYAKK